MQTRTLALTSLIAAACVSACGSEVPIGQGGAGAGGSAGSTGGTGQATGGSAGAGTGGGVATGGAGGVGGTGTGGGVATGGVGGTGTGGSVATGGAGGVGGTGTGGSGATGSCVVNEGNVLEKISAPSAIDVLAESDDLYWSHSTGTITRRVGGPGAIAVEEFASAALYPATSAAFEQPDSLISDGTYLYWRAKEGLGIWRKPLVGSDAPTQVASLPGAFSFGTSPQKDVLALSGSSIFWVQGPIHVGTQDVEYSIYSAPTSGGSATKLASYQSDSGDVLKPFQPLSLDADTSALYFGLISGGASKLVKTNLDGSNATDLFGIGYWVVESGSSVFMTGSSAVWRIPKLGGSSALVTIGLDQQKYFNVTQGIAEHAGTLYVTSFGTVLPQQCCSCGWVMSVNGADTNGSFTELWAGEGRPGAVAVAAGGTEVAFVDIDNGEIVRLKP